MAFLAKTLLFFFLLVLIYSLQIQARESKFFNKFIHISVKSKGIPESQISQAPTSVPPLAPTPAEAVPTTAAEPVTAPAEAPASFYTENENGYGLYGHGYGQFPPTKENVPSTTNENEFFNEELSAENYETSYQKSNYKSNVYSNNYNTNDYVTENQGMSDTRFMQNYRNSNNNNKEYTNDNNYNNNVKKYANGNNYNSNAYTNGNNYNNNPYTNGNNYKYNAYTNGNNYNNNAYASNYNTNGYSSNHNTGNYETEKKGMSDTRFLENGKYYYDVKNENNYFPNWFASQRETTTNEGYYGNTQKENEFNTMEEFGNEKYEP